MIINPGLKRNLASIGSDSGAVGGYYPGYILDPIKPTYKDVDGTGTLSSVITHARASQATMTDAPGPELVSNGTFDTGIDGWSSSANSSLAHSAGACQLIINASGAGVAYQGVPTVSGRAYDLSVEFKAKAVTGNVFIYVGTSPGSASIVNLNTSGTLGVFKVTFVAASATSYISIATSASATAGQSVTFDNISVREMAKIKWAPHNLLRFSEQFDNGVWGKTGSGGSPAVIVTANQAIAPDGTLTADKFIAGTGAGTHYLQQTVDAYTSATLSLYAKAAEVSAIRLALFNSGIVHTFYLSTGTSTGNGTGTITHVGNGWYHCSVSAIGASSTFAQIYTDDNNNAGDGTSGVYIWGAHLYRSDLGGMVNNPDRGDSYVPTTSAAKYLPRVGHHKFNGDTWVNKGILHESEARTNLVTYSSELDNADWAKTDITVTANAIIAPDGTTTADLLTAGTAGTDSISQNKTSTANVPHAYSFFAKRGNSDWLFVRFGDGANQVRGWFNLANGTNGTPANAGTATGAAQSIQSYGGDWYRCTLSGSVNNGLTVYSLNSFCVPSDGSLARINNSTRYMWGHQFEVGSVPSSYIPTAGATATRAAETLTVPAASLPWPVATQTGPNIVPNSGFDTDITGWTDASTGAGSISWAAPGHLSLTTVDPANRGAAQVSITTVANQVYYINVDIASAPSATAVVYVGTTAGTGDLLNSGNIGGGVKKASFTATGTTTYITVYGATSAGSTLVNSVTAGTAEGLALSLHMQGEMDFVDDDNLTTSMFIRWLLDGSNYIQTRMSTSGGLTGIVRFEQSSTGVFDLVDGPNEPYYPGLNVPYNISSRHGSTFINGAVDGVALTADLTPTSLPNLSATNLNLGNTYMGTIELFRVWGNDIGDTGIADATEPTLEASLVLDFNGLATSYTDKGITI